MSLVRRTFAREAFIIFSSFKETHNDCPVKWVALSYTFKFIHTNVSCLAITIKGMAYKIFVFTQENVFKK